MELSLHLDEYGRTVCPPPCSSSEGNPRFHGNLDYTTRCYVIENFNDNMCDTLIQDCQMTTNSDLPLTFWLGAQDEPRCLLEKLAKDIFMYHVHNLNASFADMNSCGCEWWIQVRPSANLKRINSHSQEAHLGIQFHWDKDETLRDATGVFVHPHLSTVTYLTDKGAPTIIFDDSMPDELLFTKEIKEAYISWPRMGKHLVFDGRFLHGAPSNLISEVESNAVRVTFLVNIWLHHKPLGVEPIPQVAINQITNTRIVKFDLVPSCGFEQTVQVSKASFPTLDNYSWRLGEEISITMKIPMEIVRKEEIEKDRRGSLLLMWDSETSLKISTDEAHNNN